jgi:hypothetical protein
MLSPQNKQFITDVFSLIIIFGIIIGFFAHVIQLYWKLV